MNLLYVHHSTRASLRCRHDWAGLSCFLYDVNWDAIPGWMSLSFDRPTLCLLVEEVGGRAELRVQPDTPPEGEYFGTDHLTLLASTDPVTLYSSSLRYARFACIVLNPQESRCLTVDQAESIVRAPSRLMFRDNRLHTCAKMLSAYENDDEHDAYGLGLRNALFAALVGVASNPPQDSTNRLTGRPLARVLTHIAEHLDERVSNEGLAHLAQISPTQFGHAFREATGLSPQRWQMDARVRFAQRLMVDDPTLPLSLIASRSGFADQSHFSRAFLDILGISPTAWLHQRR
jgi:AraC family transcriptional regulator